MSIFVGMCLAVGALIQSVAIVLLGFVIGWHERRLRSVEDDALWYSNREYVLCKSCDRVVWVSAEDYEELTGGISCEFCGKVEKAKQQVTDELERSVS